jgi:hypothetical protein
LSEFFSLIAEHLRLATNEVALELDEFLGFFDPNDFVGKVERIRQCLFSGRYRVLANSVRLPLSTTNGSPSDHQQTLKSGLALIEVLFCYCVHPIGRLHSSFGILLCKIHSTSRHSVTSLSEA